MQRLVRIGGRIFHHDRFLSFRSSSEVLIIFHLSEEIQVILIIKNNIQKSLYDIEFLDLPVMFHQVLTNRFPELHRIGFDLPQHWKGHQSDISFKILSGRLKFNRLEFHLKYIFYRLFYLKGQSFLNIHFFQFYFIPWETGSAKITEI